ncbi:GGDEF domain-containing protein [Anaerotalea alkaliphila]|uniref:GGDEF domain-containing protein n=1 Tax=Anaerotalea alkaliphila TaxID=2662126 RepID=A0A7X5HVQ8_9FIRM|nr:GGDEF domain-containing protein [Anaerotalea alkaliphila]NDL67509.1 GGDEF domain-containing protein [Anaerotalea alkaliphila]
MEIRQEELEALLQQMTAYEKMYDQTRLVDPLGNKVLHVVGENENSREHVEAAEPCYGVWGKSEACRNCISMRAYNEGDTIIKIESSPSEIIMVTAMPVKIGGRTLVVELLKNVTKSMVLDGVQMTDNMEIKKLLEQANAAAVTDELTRVYNKRYILEKLPVEIALARVEGRPLSLLMADIDHFKEINDTCGHLAGDHILREFASILKGAIRQERDWVARFGGEEFLLCLSHTEEDAARAIAERMRKSVEDAIFSYGGEQIRLTASFGLYTVKNGEVQDYETLVRHVDGKLYEAKKGGRNRVVG